MTPAAPHLLVDVPLDGVGPDEDILLPAGVAHHLRKVLRLADGAALSLTDGAGSRVDATLTGTTARTTACDPVAARQGPELILVQALSKGRRAEDAVRAACELGVDRIVPLVAGRTQGRPDAAAREAVRSRWQAVADAALEQSRGVRRAIVMDVAAIAGLRSALLFPDGDGLALVAVPGAPALGSTEMAVGEVRSTPAGIAIAIGPEGGWTLEEVAQFVAHGWHQVGLGPTVLRTEHAGPAALAVLAALTGRWGAGR